MTPIYGPLEERKHPARPADGRPRRRSGQAARCEHTKRWFILPILTRLYSYNFVSHFGLDQVFSAEWLAQCDTEAPWRRLRDTYLDVCEATDLQRMLYLDWKFTLADNDLVKVNRMCDLAGIEVKYPMLDSRVADLACSVPPNRLIVGSELRSYYKEMMTGFLPDKIVQKPKHGFGLPFGVWLIEHDGLSALVSRALKELEERGIFHPHFLDWALTCQRNESPHYFGELIWILTMLQLWLQHNRY